MADGDFNLATIWASIVPETSKVGPAMEDAGKEGKRRFGEAVKDLGHTITDDLEKAGSKVKDTFSGVGSSIKDIVSRAGKEGSDSLTDSFSKAGSDGAKALVGHFSSAEGPIGNVADRIGGMFGGKIGDALKNLDGPLKDIGIDVGSWQDSIQGVIDKADGFKGTINDTLGMFKDMPGVIGKVSSEMGDWAGPLAAIAAAVNAINDAVDRAGGQRKWDDVINPPTAPGQTPAGNSFWDKAGRLFQSWVPGGTFSGGGKPAAPKPLPDLPPDMVMGDAGSADQPGKPREPHTGGIGGDSGFSDLFSGGSGIGAAGGTDWNALAGAESSGNWHNPDTGGTGHYGGLQFDQNTWNDFGGQDFAPRPDLATEDQQKTVANRVPPDQRPKRWAQTWWTQKGGTGGRASSAGSSGPSSSLSGSGFSASSGQLPGTPPDENSLRNWVEQNFGIPNTFGTGSWENAAHPYDGKLHHPGGAKLGYAFDFHGSTEQMDALANWVADNYKDKTLELIHQGPGFDHNREIKNAKFGDVYGPDVDAAHRDHVHWAMTQAPGRGASLGGDRGAVGGPTGAQHDPIYTTQANTGAAGAGGSADQAMGSQLGSGLVNGVLQEFGLDGSVFKSFGGSSNPLQFGITKLASGLINSFGGMFGGKGGGDGAALSFGGGGGIPGIGALAGLIPHPTGVPIGPGGSQNVSGGDTHIYNGPVGPQLNFTHNGNGQATVPPELSERANAGAAGRGAAMGVAPNAGNMPG